MDAHVRLVFAGEVLDGFSPASVKRKVGQWLNLDAAKLDAMFTGRRVVVKRAIPAEEAASWVSRFQRLGARLEVEPVEPDENAYDAPPAAASRQKPAAPPAPADTGPPTAFPPTEPMIWPPGAVPPPASPGEAGSFDFAATRPMEWPAQSPAGAPPGESALFFGYQGGTNGQPKAAPAPWSQPPESPSMASPWMSGNTGDLDVHPFALPPDSQFGEPESTAAPKLNITELAQQMAVTCPNCGETQQRAVYCRHCSTDLARALAAREEERMAERARRLSESHSRRGPPLLPANPGMRSASDAARFALDEDAAPLFGFGFSGRLGRMSYLAGSLVFWSGLCLLVLMAVMMPGTLSFIGLGVGTLLLLVWSARLTVLRLHDINRSGWWSLLLGVPTIGTLASIIVMLIPGDETDNDYGAPVAERHAWLAIAAVVVIGLSVSLGWKATKSAIQRYASTQPQSQSGAPRQDTAAANREKLQTFLGSADAANAFLNVYAKGLGHRAFASAPSGAWGMSHGASSRDLAALDALSDCKRRLEDGGGICQLVHVDSDWVIDPNR